MLKLDRRFLSSEEPLYTRNRAILPDILNSLRKLGIDAICEGVETQEPVSYTHLIPFHKKLKNVLSIQKMKRT